MSHHARRTALRGVIAGLGLTLTVGALAPSMALADNSGTLSRSGELTGGPACDDGSANTLFVQNDTDWTFKDSDVLHMQLALSGSSNAQEMCGSEHGAPPVATSIGLTDSISAAGIDITQCQVGNKAITCQVTKTTASATYTTPPDADTTHSSHNFLGGDGIVIDGNIHSLRETTTGSFNFGSDHYEVNATGTVNP